MTRALLRRYSLKYLLEQRPERPNPSSFEILLTGTY